MVYVHATHYRYYGKSRSRSKKKFPQSYGPFSNEAAANYWAEWKGLTTYTLSNQPADHNIIVELSNLIA